jgi:integrase
MAVYKRGGVWWYEFVFGGQRVRESTHHTNKRVAEQIEAAHKTRLAKGEVGIEERKPVPTLRDFSPRFEQAIELQCAEKPLTVEFYKAKLKTLLDNDSLASSRLDTIDEAAIEKYTQARGRITSRRKKPLAPGSINRELATLRRLLRLAHEWKVIQRVPRVRLLRGERNREFTLNHSQEKAYLAVCPASLCDVATLLVDTGLRLGEALSLEWPQVQLEPANGAKFGYLTVLSGKAKSRKSRNVPLSERVVSMLKRWRPSELGYVFHREDGSPLPDSHLDQQHARIRALLKLPADFVLHSLRHTFGTRLGESGADAFTIMRLMGHSTVTVSQRYVHPSPEAVELAFGRMNALNLQRVPTNSPTVPQVDLGVVQ